MSKVAEYIRELDELLLDIDPDTRNSLVQGIREELEPLNADAADQRMKELGDPAFIAASVHDQTQTTQPPSLPTSSSRGPRWIAPLTVALLTVGGLLVPVLGWAAGIVLLWSTSIWTVRQKAIGSLSLLGSTAIIVATILPGIAPSPDPMNPVIIWPTIVGLYIGAVVIYTAVAWYLLRASRQARHRHLARAIGTPA